MSLHGAGILAGAYLGKDISERTTLLHAVSDEPVTLGRIKRDSGEALCNRNYSDATTLVDSGAWIALSGVTCLKCLDILRRYRPDLRVR